MIYIAGPRPRRARPVRQHLARGQLQRAVRRRVAGCRGHGAAVPPVLVPGRHAEPRGAGDARLHPRGRRARLLAGPRLRRRVRQPRTDRGLRDRRRRGGDRAAGRVLALQQVPEPGQRRRRAADPAPQRLQDRQSRRSSPGSPTTNWSSCSRATATGPGWSRRRPGRDAPADGGDAGPGAGRDPPDPGRGPPGGTRPRRVARAGR